MVLRVGRVSGVDATLGALAEPTRRRVVELLLERPHRPSELSRAVRMSPPAMSRHLRVLRRCGLIQEERSERDARVRTYRLRPEPFRDLYSWLQTMESFWTDQLGAFSDHVEASKD